MDIDGARVLVTGASSGIGATLAPMLAARGATVGLVARRADRLDEVLARCTEHQPACRRWAYDLSDLDVAERVGLEAWDAFGHLDVVVNNAAVPRRKAATALTPADVEHTMSVNFFSPTRLTLAVLPRMLERDSGVIVNVSSVGGRLGIFHEAAYSASKFALCGWSEALAVDLWSTGVDVRLILPGAIDTEIWEQPDNESALYDGPLEPPEVVAEGIIAAIEGDTFEHYLPDLKPVVEFKTGDIDTFMVGLADMAGQTAPEARR
jgi:short-subunit dehydrogenase